MPAPPASITFAEALEELHSAGLVRNPLVRSSGAGPEAVVGGRRVVVLCSNDYLNLASDPRLAEAAAGAVRRWGAGSGASRLVSGNTDLHTGLERSLAAFKQTEDAILFSSGYLANVGAISALVGPGDVVFSDELNHASIIDGCRLCGAGLRIYRHCDMEDLGRLLARTPGRRRLIVTDTVFSMDGDLAPLDQISETAKRAGAILLADEAHATGVLGPAGAGAIEAAGLAGRIDLVMGTLSKAFGSAGGFICGPSAMIQWLRNRARTYIFDTAPAPASVGAALAALEIIRCEPGRRTRLLASAKTLAGGLKRLGYRVGKTDAAIISVAVGAPDAALGLSRALLAQGVFVPAIRPPSVPEGTSRLRVTVTAGHTADHIRQALQAFRECRRHLPAGAAGPVTFASSKRRCGKAGLDPGILGSGGLFVTGTGTGVGKTLVSTAIMLGFSAAGLSAAYLKPAQTGAADGDDDAAFVAAAASVGPERAATAYRLGLPLAPRVAAEMEGETIEPELIRRKFQEMTNAGHTVVAEGAGGLLVPLSAAVSMAGLAGMLGLPVVIVAGAGLGTLNHSAMTVQAARAEGLHILGIVLNEFPDDPGPAELTNPAELHALTGAALLGVIPVMDLSKPGWAGSLTSRLAPALGGTFDAGRFLADCSSKLDALR